jgi:LysM repeat protein
MNITRSSRHLWTALSLATALLLGRAPNAFSTRSRLRSRRAVLAVGEPAKAGTGAPVAEAPVALQPDHPETYTVVPGDTLWSIAGRFLQNPWQWRQIWRQNPQIRNPNRIYPGDVLRFSYDANGKPQLEVAEREEVPLFKLSPRSAGRKLTQPIPPVPRGRGRIVPDPRPDPQRRGVAQGCPISWPTTTTRIYADRDRVYARGGRFDQPRYQVFRPGEADRTRLGP